MTGDDELLQALRPVVNALNRLGVRYCIGGSVASSLHGAARSTLDVDLAAELNERTARELARDLQGEYYVSEQAAVEAVKRNGCFNLIHLATSFKVDIFLGRHPHYDRIVQDRALDTQLGEPALAVRVVTPEDILLAKLEWFRLGDETSERQWNDVCVVAKLHHDQLDIEYLRHWAAELRVSDLLERLLQTAGVRD